MSGLLQSVNSTWLRRIEASRKEREPWRKTAEICTNFYQGALGFLWSKEFRAKYFDNLPAPRFKITIAKAFEFVALVGPVVYWDYAQRLVLPHKDVNITPEAFGDPRDPAVMQIYTQFIEDHMIQVNRNKTRNSLMEAYLNYAPKEQPYGGMIEDSRLAVKDALITGRGCLWTTPYSFPGSDRVLTGSFFEPSSRLFVDPDSRKSNLSDATWIARQHVEPYWVVERRFGYKDGELKSALNIKDGQDDDEYSMHYESGKTHELIVWYEVFSKCGIGTRGKGSSRVVHEAFEEKVGDYAYVCVTKGLNHPLNLKEEMLTGNEEEVIQAVNWPVPYYKDNRWPVSVLDFYPMQDGAWPIAPLAPGLGELIFLNVIMSCLMDRIYENSRNIRMILKRAGDEAIREIKSDKFNLTLEMQEAQATNIKELVSYLDMPVVNGDVFALADRVSLQFDKRVGLPDFMYGMNQGGKIMRTAADVHAKSEASSTRPEYMSRCAEKWQSEVANNERICAGWNVKGEHVRQLFGDTGAMLWDSLIANEDPEVYVRSMQCEVVANSSRRPNKEKDFDNMSRLAGYLLPALQASAQQTGDYTAFNDFVKSIGDSMDVDTRQWAVGSMPTNQNVPAGMQQPTEQEMPDMSESVLEQPLLPGMEGEMY